MLSFSQTIQCNVRGSLLPRYASAVYLCCKLSSLCVCNDTAVEKSPLPGQGQHCFGKNKDSLLWQECVQVFGVFSLALLGKLATVWKMRTDKTVSPPLSLTHSFTFIFFLSHAQPHKYRSAITGQRLGITSKDPFLIEKHIYYCLMEQYID